MAESDYHYPALNYLYQRYRMVRSQSVLLAAELSDEDCCAQSMPDASPVKWHLAHTTWFFETFILEQFERPFIPFHPAFRVLFNSYYNGVGDMHVRANRGLLTRPALADVKAYRDDIDRRIANLIERSPPDVAARIAQLMELGLHHEQQHQELVLTDIKHLFSMSPLYPAYRAGEDASPYAPERSWVAFDGGQSQIGHAGNRFGFDNEFPRHRVFIEPFLLAKDLVTNAEYLEYLQAGGYDDPAHWLSEGWDWRCTHQVQAPYYWRSAGARGWNEFTLHGLLPLELHAPVNHLSYYEADAYARWRDARLPTEAEWEHAASTDAGMFRHMHGSRWQWTSSSYSAYPGYRPATGAIGEYNGKFMVNQYVLRGSSSATPDGHARSTYRNFFPAGARWQFTGLRLAQSQ